MVSVKLQVSHFLSVSVFPSGSYNLLSKWQRVKKKNKNKQIKRLSIILNPRNNQHIYILLALCSLQSSRTFISSGFWLLPLAPGSALHPVCTLGISPAPWPLSRSVNEPRSLLQGLVLLLPHGMPSPPPHPRFFLPNHPIQAPPTPLQQEIFQAPLQGSFALRYLTPGFFCH